MGWKIVLLVILILILLFVTICIIDCHSLVVRTYEFTSPKVGRNMKFVLLTDLHGTSFGHDNDKLIQKLKSLSFDAVLICGDMYTAMIKSGGVDVALSLVRRLSQEYPVYYANGNHELKTRERKDEFGDVYDEFIKGLKECNVHFLSNESEEIDGNVIITGLDVSFDYYRKSKKFELPKEKMEEYLGECSRDKYHILLAHNPEYLEGYSDWGADLVLSGHYHGGLMRLPFIGGVISPRFKIFPKLHGGKYTHNETNMVLSCGLGTHTLPIRVFNPGEISYIIVNNE